jgi:hypothetical protein
MKAKILATPGETGLAAAPKACVAANHRMSCPPVEIIEVGTAAEIFTSPRQHRTEPSLAGAFN